MKIEDASLDANKTEMQEYNSLLKHSRRVYETAESGQTTLQIYNPKPFGEKRTYKQQWAEYNMAKTNEDILFKKMLQEILFLSIEEDSYPKVGRKGYSIKEKLFAMCVKIYYRSDLRKCQSILKELKNLHYINRVPCFKSIDNFFNDARLSKILDDLILISALPMAELEKTGAIDSTGFSVSRFDRWVDYKWGKHEGKERVWRKAHAVCGCKSNIFLSVAVTEKNTGDISMVEEVIGTRTRYFKMDNFTADKAYSSRRVLKFLNGLGMNPFIPFKKNVTGKSMGCMVWSQMFYFFKHYNDEFLRKYHARSNIESSFHMVKNRFGDHLLTKNMAGNVNEIKVKFLCHNLCCLIVEAFESGISLDFDNCVKTVGLCKI